MASRTAVAGDDFERRKLLRLIGVAGAGYTIYQLAKGRKVGILAAASAVVTIISFLGDE